MRVLQCHNYYQQAGGEDRVVADEHALLTERGHTVERYQVHNDAVSEVSRPRLMARTVFSRSSYRALRERMRAFEPDVVHVHNTLPMMSPSVYFAARDEGVAVVQTLHNYRMVCPSALCLRDGSVCEACNKKRVKWPAVVHGCYRGSRAASAAVAGMLAVHYTLGTYQRLVHRYIACTAFAKSKVTESGIDPARVMIKPNFLATDLPAGPGDGGYAMFLGRLSMEKGLDALLTAWERHGQGLPELRVGGDGPMRGRVESVAAAVPNVTYLGRLSDEAVTREVGGAAALMFPSITFEGMPLTLIESYQLGTPVIGSDLGSMASLIDPGQTGELFTPNDPDAIADATRRFFARPEPDWRAMRDACRHEYETHYTPDSNYKLLIEVYRCAILAAKGEEKTRRVTPLPVISVDR
ncbi:MAG: glycosyltransferase family 4 protein [Planctomycetota bacterium]